MRWPVRHQILVPMVSILLLTIAVVSALNALLASQRAGRQLERQLADVSRTLATSNFPLESNVLLQMRGLTGAEYVVVDDGGRALAASDEALIVAAETAPATGRLNMATTVTASTQRYFHVALPIERRARGREHVRLHVFFSEAAWREARWQAVWPALAIGGVSIALVAVVVSLLARRVTRPIHELHLQVGRIAQGDFRTMEMPQRDDEVKDLAAAVNQMAQRLVQYEEQIRSSERLRTLGTLGGGIAHQIRNAATGCRIALDLHQRDCPTLSGHGHSSESIDVAVRQLAQIEASVQRFLALGKPSARIRAQINLIGVIYEALDLVRPLARHMRVELHAKLPPEPAIMAADGQSLTQVIVNLAINAIEATAEARLTTNGKPVSENGCVELSLRRLPDDRFELSMANPGPGPAAAIQQRLFEPFVTDKAGGTGLGLAVAKQIAEDHGGSIRWEQRRETTWFLVVLPAAGVRTS